MNSSSCWCLCNPGASDVHLDALWRHSTTLMMMMMHSKLIRRRMNWPEEPLRTSKLSNYPPESNKNGQFDYGWTDVHHKILDNESKKANVKLVNKRRISTRTIVPTSALNCPVVEISAVLNVNIYINYTIWHFFPPLTLIVEFEYRNSNVCVCGSCYV